MQFRVGNAVTSEVGNGPLPDKLVELDLPAAKTQLDQNFVFGRVRGAGPLTLLRSQMLEIVCH